MNFRNRGMSSRTIMSRSDCVARRAISNSKPDSPNLLLRYIFAAYDGCFDVSIGIANKR